MGDYGRPLEFGVSVVPNAAGYEQKELAVEISDHTLTIKGERTEMKQEKEKDFRLHERLEREFERRFALPAEADTGHAKASFSKGVLEIRAPKGADGEVAQARDREDVTNRTRGGGTGPLPGSRTSASPGATKIQGSFLRHAEGR